MTASTAFFGLEGGIWRREAPALRAQSAAQHLDLALVTTRDGFLALEADWNDLFERAGRGTQLFQTFNWLWHWSNHYLDPHGRTQLALVTGRRNGALVMVWPVVRETGHGIRSLAWMGEPVSQYGDVLIDDLPDAAAVLRAGWQHLVRHARADVTRLRKVRADAAVAPLLAEVGAIVTEELAAPYLDIAATGSFDDYEQRASSSARRNRRRQRRRFAERGESTLEWAEGGARARALTETAFALKKVWLRERGLVSPAFSDVRMERFFTDVTDARERPAGCHVAALLSNGQPAAIEIGVHAKSRTAIHVIVYDRAYEKVAAGALLMEDSIRNAFANRVGVYDFLAPADTYKTDWASETVAVRDWAVPLTALGRVYAHVYLKLAREAVKGAMKRLPIGARRLLAQRMNAAMAVL